MWVYGKNVPGRGKSKWGGLRWKPACGVWVCGWSTGSQGTAGAEVGERLHVGHGFYSKFDGNLLEIFELGSFMI